MRIHNNHEHMYQGADLRAGFVDPHHLHRVQFPLGRERFKGITRLHVFLLVGSSIAPVREGPSVRAAGMVAGRIASRRGGGGGGRPREVQRLTVDFYGDINVALHMCAALGGGARLYE